jgi:hypothetical protein
VLQCANQSLSQFVHGIACRGNELSSQFISRGVDTPCQDARGIAKQIKRIRCGCHGRNRHFACGQLKQTPGRQLLCGPHYGCGIVTGFALLLSLLLCVWKVWENRERKKQNTVYTRTNTRTIPMNTTLDTGGNP